MKGVLTVYLSIKRLQSTLLIASFKLLLHLPFQHSFRKHHLLKLPSCTPSLDTKKWYCHTMSPSVYPTTQTPQTGIATARTSASSPRSYSSSIDYTPTSTRPAVLLWGLGHFNALLTNSAWKGSTFSIKDCACHQPILTPVHQNRQ